MYLAEYALTHIYLAIKHENRTEGEGKNGLHKHNIMKAGQKKIYILDNCIKILVAVLQSLEILHYSATNPH